MASRNTAGVVGGAIDTAGALVRAPFPRPMPTMTGLMMVAGINPMLPRIASSATPARGTAGRAAFGFFADELLADDGKSGPTSPRLPSAGSIRWEPSPYGFAGDVLRNLRERRSPTLPWRIKLPERVPRIEIKARSRDRAFCLVGASFLSSRRSPSLCTDKKTQLRQHERPKVNLLLTITDRRPAGAPGATPCRYLTYDLRANMLSEFALATLSAFSLACRLRSRSSGSVPDLGSVDAVRRANDSPALAIIDSCRIALARRAAVRPGMWPQFLALCDQI